MPTAKKTDFKFLYHTPKYMIYKKGPVLDVIKVYNYQKNKKLG